MKDYQIYYLIEKDGHKEIHNMEVSAENPIQALKIFDELADEFKINALERTTAAPIIGTVGCLFGLDIYQKATDCGRYIMLG